MAKPQSTETRNARAYAAGYLGSGGGQAGAYRAYERARKAPAYQRWAAAAAAEHGTSQRLERRLSSEFNKRYAAAAFAKTPFRESRKGRFHELLAYTGLREHNARHNIGESKPRRRR